MADEFIVAVQSVLDTFESMRDTFLEVAVVDSLRLATGNVEPSKQGERDIRWAEKRTSQVGWSSFLPRPACI